MDQIHHVHHISTGGTIAFDGSGMLGGNDLLDHLQIEIPGIRWSHEEAGRLPSSWVTPMDLAALARRIDDASSSRCPSMVLITHGTDTMEEASVVADMVCRDDVPIVFSGAMRPGPGGDGPRNISDAIRAGLASSDASRGVTVVMDGTIHAAMEVRKLHSEVDAAFHSREPLGRLGADGVRWRDGLPYRLRLPHAEPRHDVRLVRLVSGDTGEQIREAASHGVDGVVVELFGAGNAPLEVFDLLASVATSGVVVALTTRCGDGPIRPARHAEDMLVLPGLDGLKARLALMLALASDRVDVLRSWATRGM